MFTAFMSLLIFALFYLLYRFIKIKIYDLLGKGPIDTYNELLILPVAIWIFAFVVSRGFSNYTLTDHVPTIELAYSEFYWTPFKELYLILRNTTFYNLIYDQDISFWSEIMTNFSKDYIRFFISVLPLGFVIALVNRTFVKSLLVMLIIRGLVGLMIGEAYIMTSMTFSLFAFLIAYAGYKILYRQIQRRTSIETFTLAKVQKTMVIGFLILLCVLPLSFANYDTRYYEDQWTSAERIKFKQPIELNAQNESFKLTLTDFRLFNKESIELFFSVKPITPLDIPYENSCKSIEIKTSLNDMPLNFGIDVSSNANDSRMSFDNISYYPKSDAPSSIFPIKLYGVTSARYLIHDQTFTSRIKVLSSRWLKTKEGYDCYTYTYQVPKLKDYAVSVGNAVTYDNSNITSNKSHQQYGKRQYAHGTTPVKIDSNSEYDIYSVDNYFYDFYYGPIPFENVQNLKHNFYESNITVNIENVPTEPIWMIESVDAFDFF